jgi:soluble cytochrome b562
MQLGTMSNMLRGLPMQAQTTQQYVAAPNPVTQAIGAAGAGASLYNAFGGGKAEGGVIKGYAKGGIMSYAEGGGTDALDKASKMAAIANMMPRIGFSAGGISNDIEHDLYSMDEDDLQKQLKESSSPSVKRMAQRILRMKQMENQPQQPSMAGGGIIAFAGGGTPTSSEELQQRVMQAKPTGDITTAPVPMQSNVLPAPREDAIAAANNVQPAKQPPNSLEAAMSDPNIPDVMKGQLADIQTKYARTTDDIIKEKRAAYEAAGVNPRNPEERANLMKERANADDEAKRNRYLQAAAFFARWGSTPGSTLAAGLTAVRERVPEIIESEKEAKKIRMEINKSIASLDEATRLENKGEVDAATAIKEKDAEKMQAVYFKLSDIEMAAKKEDFRLEKQRQADEARAAREDARYATTTQSNERIHAAQNATTLQAERIRADAMKENKASQNETNMLTRLTAAAQLQANVEKTIEAETAKPTYAQLVTRASMAETPDTLPLITAAKKELALKQTSFDRMRKDAQDTVDFVREKAGMPKPKDTGTSGTGGKDRPLLTDPSLQK